jgi:hypothetical protein
MLRVHMAGEKKTNECMYDWNVSFRTRIPSFSPLANLVLDFEE